MSLFLCLQSHSVYLLCSSALYLALVLSLAGADSLTSDNSWVASSRAQQFTTENGLCCVTTAWAGGARWVSGGQVGEPADEAEVQSWVHAPDLKSCRKRRNDKIPL